MSRISEKENAGCFIRNQFSLEGWINYLDVLTGKTIGDFRKPIDVAAKIRQNH